MGALLNRFGFRIVTILGCLSCSVGLTLGSFAPKIIILHTAFSLPFAVGVSFIYVSSPIVVTHVLHQKTIFRSWNRNSGPRIGNNDSWTNSSSAIVDLFDWRNTFRVFAGTLTVTSLTGCFLYQRTSPDEHERSPSKKFRMNISLLKNPTILMLVIRGGLCTFARIVPYVHLVSISPICFVFFFNKRISHNNSFVYTDVDAFAGRVRP